MRIPLALLFLFFNVVSCSSVSVRNDPAPSPSSSEIAQARLEFEGCNGRSIGTTICFPDSNLFIVTEFPGEVIYFSGGAECSIRVQINATPPKTEIVLPAVKSVCPVVVYYLPRLGVPVYSQIWGIYGEVSLQPDNSFLPHASISLSLSEIVKFKFSNTIRGAYVSRQFESPQQFSGDTFAFKPGSIGTDLIQIKLFKDSGEEEYRLVTANYYSPYALDLLIKEKTVSNKGTILTFSDWVTAVTINGEIVNDLTVNIPKNFTGYVRSYTVKGRTSVMYFEKGVLEWTK